MDLIAGPVTPGPAYRLGEKVDDPIIFPVSPLSLGLPLFAGGVLTQAPFALVLGCSDARAPVEAGARERSADVLAMFVY